MTRSTKRSQSTSWFFHISSGSRESCSSSAARPSSFTKPSTLGERFVDYLAERDNPAPYTGDELGKLYSILDWIAGVIVYGRPVGAVRLSQSYVLPQEHKGLFVDYLSPVIRILFMATWNSEQIYLILEGPDKELVELCVIDRDHMRKVQHLFACLTHQIPLILLSTEENSQEPGILPTLKEERILATLWDCIREKVSEDVLYVNPKREEMEGSFERR